MKTFFTVMIAALVLNIHGLGWAYTKAEADGVYGRVTQAAASGDTKSILEVLPGLEDLWTYSPELYLRATDLTARGLGSKQNDPAAKESLGALFSAIFKKNCTTIDNKEAAACFRLKLETALYFLGFEDTRTDKARLLAIAGFVGEVRTRIIPNYANRGTSQPGLQILMQAGVKDAHQLKDPAQVDAYQKAVLENDQLLIMNELQLSLFRVNQILTFHLLQCCARMQRVGAKDDKFIDDVVSKASLTTDERKRLAFPSVE